MICMFVSALITLIVLLAEPEPSGAVKDAGTNSTPGHGSGSTTTEGSRTTPGSVTSTPFSPTSNHTLNSIPPSVSSPVPSNSAANGTTNRNPNIGTISSTTSENSSSTTETSPSPTPSGPSCSNGVPCYNGGTCRNGNCHCITNASGYRCEQINCGPSIVKLEGAAQMGATSLSAIHPFAECEWSLLAPPGYGMNLTIETAFSEIQPECGLGSLEIYEGNQTDRFLMDQLCTTTTGGLAIPSSQAVVKWKDLTPHGSLTIYVHAYKVDRCGKGVCGGNGSGVCTEVGDSFHCSCPCPYLGGGINNPCRERNVCDDQPCMNGGACFLGAVTKFYCICPPGFSGFICQNQGPQTSSTTEVPLTSSSRTPIPLSFVQNRTSITEKQVTSTSLPVTMSNSSRTTPGEGCQPDLCQNGGTCYPTRFAPYYSCFCYPWFNGTHCEQVNCDELSPQLNQSRWRVPPIGFLKNANCSWNIEWPNSMTKIWRLSLELESITDHCPNASVLMTELTGNGSRTIYSSCGARNARTFETERNQVRITAETSNDAPLAFSIKYVPEPVDSCAEKGPDFCNKRGTCVQEGYNAICECSNNCYFGLHCEYESSCDLKEYCGSHGRCAWKDKNCTTYQCYCDPGYYGPNCQRFVPL